MPEEPKTVKVFARIRPTNSFAYNNIILSNDQKTIDVHGRLSAKGGFVNNQTSDWSFKLDGIFHDVSQDLLYEVTTREVVSRAFSGYNGTVICYGQTGSGKTFTMTGANETFQNRGLIPRAIQQVFREISELPDFAINVKISYLEIYNETLFDLLSGSSSSGKQQPMTIMEDEVGVKVVGLSQHIANNEEEALNMLFEGETTRAIAAHQMNKHSSRSHVVFTITVQSRSRTESSTTYTVSKLNFVDLAGSERLGKTESQGRTQHEATYINKSLTFLEQTIIALTDKRREHVPFRQSKLTHFLKDSIGGNCQTIMFANIWGEEAQLEETISTLRFGTRMMRVPVAVAANQMQDASAMVRQLEKEVRTLKQELSMHDTLNNKGNQTYDTITDSQMAEINRQVKNFLEGSADNIDIVNVRQIQTVFGTFRTMYRNMEKDVEKRLQEKYELTEKQSQGGGPGGVADRAKGGGGGDSVVSQDVRLVGELDGQGFGVGVAPPGSKPQHSSVVDQKKAAQQANAQQAASKKKGGGAGAGIKASPRSSRDVSPSRAGSPNQTGDDKGGAPGSASAERPSTPPPRHIAFEDFKKDEGLQLNKILNENKDILKTKINQSRETANQINNVKRKMDETRDELNEIAAQRENLGDFQGLEPGERVVEESEYELIMKLKDLKKRYREYYAELQKVRSEVQYCQKLVDQCRQRLISDFDAWYVQSYLGPNKDFTPTIETDYGQRQAPNITSISEDQGERLDRTRTNLLMEDPESYSYHLAKQASIRKYNMSKARGQLQHYDGLIMPPKKPTQMILTTPY